MIWGLKIKPQRTYSQTVASAFHVSQAVLDISSTVSNSDIKLMMRIDSKKEFILCVLNKSENVQIPLDLNFSVGDNVSFYCIGGTGTVHLTGYLVNNFPNPSKVEETSYDDDSDSEDDESEGTYDFEGNRVG